MRRLCFSSLLALACFAGGCGDDTQPPAGPAPDAGVDAPPIGAIAPCLGQPTKLERPPSGALPCELLPPGFVATKAAPSAEAPR
jgi:hypothetical protein